MRSSMLPCRSAGLCSDMLVSPWSSVVGLCRLLHAGCPMSFQRLQLSMSCLHYSWLQRDCSIVPSRICPDKPCSKFYSVVLPFYKAPPARARQGHLCSQIPQTYVVISIFLFPPIVPQGRAISKPITVFASILILFLFMF